MKLVLLALVWAPSIFLIHWLHETDYSTVLTWHWADSLPFSGTLFFEHSWEYNVLALAITGYFLWALLRTVIRSFQMRAMFPQPPRRVTGNVAHGLLKICLFSAIILLVSFISRNVRIRRFQDLDIVRSLPWSVAQEIIAFTTLVIILTATYLTVVIFLWDPYRVDQDPNQPLPVGTPPNNNNPNI